MSKSDFYRPRLSFEVGEDQYNRFTNLVPWGLRSQLMSALLDSLCDLIEEEGEVIITLAIKKLIGAREITRIGRRQSG